MNKCKYETVFKNIDNRLRTDGGCSGPTDYIEQTSWVLFLKFLNEYEIEKEFKAEFEENTYTEIIPHPYKWSDWAVPRTEGKPDYNSMLTGDDLLEFVNEDLFPFLRKFKDKTTNTKSFIYKIGEIFSELKNKIQDGYCLRDVIDKIDELEFSTNENKHELSSLYEDKISNMGNSGLNGGEYYTPRPLIRAIVEVVDPQIGETVYDGAVGSAGFLCEAFEYMKNKAVSSEDWRLLQNRTFQGKEKKSQPYIIGLMNMMLHGIEKPDIVHTNTLSENVMNYETKDRVNVVIANPPFGAKEQNDIQQNFPISTSETAELFLQHFIKKLKRGGRCGIVLKNTILNNTGKTTNLRKLLLDECNLHTILELPQNTFTTAGIKSVVLFFNKGEVTRDIWYYQLNLDRKLGKSAPLNNSDLEEFKELYNTRELSKNSWIVNINDINQETLDLTPKNPNCIETVDTRTPNEILDEILALAKKETNSMKKLNTLNFEFSKMGRKTIETTTIGNVCNVRRGTTITKKQTKEGNIPVIAGGIKPAYFHNVANREAYCITISGSGANAGFVNIWDQPIFASDCTTVEIIDESQNIWFVYYYLISVQQFIYDNLKSGTAQPHVYAKDVAKLNYPLVSIEKQRQIVAKLDTVFSECNKIWYCINSKLENLELLRAAAIKNELGYVNNE